MDSSSSDLETFEEICDFVEEIAAKKAAMLGPEGVRSLREMVSDTAAAAVVVVVVVAVVVAI